MKRRLTFVSPCSKRLLISVLLALVLMPGLSFAQSGEQSPASQLPGVAPRKEDPATANAEREMEKKRNVQRQEEIKRDSEKLLELATELKQYVDKTNENIISLDVIKKADQIEKLAKSVKEKMKTAN